jgi:gliding motility-associated protein GldM
MAGGKESPRQKMIGMMYLVLTAMLALNVSRQVLNAFAVVNGGLKVTNKNYDEKNGTNYQIFEKAMKDDPVKTGKFYNNAMQAKKLSAALCVHIDSLKALLISVTDKKPWAVADTIPLIDVDSKENFDIPTRIMVNTAAAEDGTKGEAHKLKILLGQYRKQMLALLDKPGDSSSINIGMLTPPVYNKVAEEKQSWEQYNFEEQPLASAVVTLTRIQNDVKNAETSVVQKLLSSIDRNSFKVDAFDPEVIPKTTYITLGDSFHAQIFLAARNNTQIPQVFIDSINGKAIEEEKVPVVGSIGRYNVKPTSEGPVVFSGTIKMKDPSGGGKMQSYPFRSTYLAARPSVVVSPTEMNVFYIGVPNPVSISAAGFANSDLQPSCSGGTLSRGDNGYTVTLPMGTTPTKDPTTGPFCTISVSGRMPDGSHRSLGEASKFRIKRVPDPTCYVANKKGDIDITKAQLSIATQVQSRMDNFDFDLSYAVTSFEMVVTVNGQTVKKLSNSNLFTPEMRTLMNQVGKGSHIIIQDVHVHGPDSRVIPGVNITLN